MKLGRATLFVRRLGRRWLTALTDLLLAPATPSNTARAGGAFPIVRSLRSLSGSEPTRDGAVSARTW